MDSLVTTEWLAKELGANDLRIVDASYFLDARDARAEFEAGHIPGAVFMDLGELSDTGSSLPNMVPSAAASRLPPIAQAISTAIRIWAPRKGVKVEKTPAATPAATACGLAERRSTRLAK